MKNILLILLILLSYKISCADSPITSTDIYKSYKDIEIVKYARKKAKMDDNIADYLHSTGNKIDIKAAIINAIGWSIDGTKNAEAYSNYIFDKSLKELEISQLEAGDLFCLGYLQVMDDYFHPIKAIPFIEKANELKGKSFTVAIINALIHAQNIMDDQGNWCEMWNIVYKVFNDKSISGDLNEAAKKIIWDYMVNYKCK